MDDVKTTVIGTLDERDTNTGSKTGVFYTSLPHSTLNKWKNPTCKISGRWAESRREIYNMQHMKIEFEEKNNKIVAVWILQCTNLFRFIGWSIGSLEQCAHFYVCLINGIGGHMLQSIRNEINGQTKFFSICGRPRCALARLYGWNKM